MLQALPSPRRTERHVLAIDERSDLVTIISFDEEKVIAGGPRRLATTRNASGPASSSSRSPPCPETFDVTKM